MTIALAYLVTLVWFVVIVVFFVNGNVPHFFRKMSLQTTTADAFVHFAAEKPTHDEQFPLRAYFNEPLVVMAIPIQANCTSNCTWQSNMWANVLSTELNSTLKPCRCDKRQDFCRVHSVEGYHLVDDIAERNTWMAVNNASVMVVNICKQRHAFAQDAALDWIAKQVKNVIDKSKAIDLKNFPFALHTLQETELLANSKEQIQASFASYECLFTLPIAFLFLAYVVGPLASIVLCTIPTIFLVTFSVLDIVQNNSAMTFASFLPPIFVALMIAVSLNYALFLFARFHEEIELHLFDDAMVTTVKEIGKSIVTSTVLLSTAFSSLLICDINTKYEVIRSLGIGCLVTVVAAGVVSITLLPSLVTILGLHCQGCIGPCTKAGTAWAASFSSLPYFSYAIRRPEKILGAALLFTAPMMVLVAFGRTSVDQMQILCLQAPGMVSYNLLRDSHFRLGILAGTEAVLQADPGTDPFNGTDLNAMLKTTVDVYRPNISNFEKSNVTCQRLSEYCAGGLKLPQFGSETIGQQLMWRSCYSTCNASLTPNFTREGVLSASFFQTTSRAVDTFTKRRNQDHDWRGIQSIAHAPYNLGMEIDVELAKQYIRDVANNSMEAERYRELYVKFTSPDGHAAMVDLKLPFDPFSGDNQYWLESVKTKVQPMKVWSPIGGLVSKVNGIMSDFWRLLGLSFVFLTIATVMIFRSLLLPLRLMFSIVFTFLWTFGSCYLIFQIIGRFSGLYWVLLPGAAPIVMGLTLDYDLFLIARVFHLRGQGYSTKTSLKKAGEATQPSICSAGLVMSIAFSALLFSDIWLLREFGFVLIFGTLMDAFFVRPLLVPALMLVFDEECNWWPRRMPPISHEEGFTLMSEFSSSRSQDLESPVVHLWHGTISNDNVDIDVSRAPQVLDNVYSASMNQVDVPYLEEVAAIQCDREECMVELVESTSSNLPLRED